MGARSRWRWKGGGSASKAPGVGALQAAYRPRTSALALCGCSKAVACTRSRAWERNLKTGLLGGVCSRGCESCFSVWRTLLFWPLLISQSNSDMFSVALSLSPIRAPSLHGAALCHATMHLTHRCERKVYAMGLRAATSRRPPTDGGSTLRHNACTRIPLPSVRVNECSCLQPQTKQPTKTIASEHRVAYMHLHTIHTAAHTVQDAPAWSTPVRLRHC